MDISSNTRAIILSRSDYRESDSLITAYTEEFGRMTLVARGMKKPGSKLAGHLEPMTLSKAMIIKGKGFDYIASASLENAYLEIRNDLEKIVYAGKIISLFLSFVRDNEKDKRLFSLLQKYLDLIDKEIDFNEEKGILFFVRFAFSLLGEMGYRPEMHNCLHCGQKLESGGNRFDLKGGGVVCEHCLSAFSDISTLLPISDNCVRIIRYFLSGDNSHKIRFSKKIIKEMDALIRKFILFLK